MIETVARKVDPNKEQYTIDLMTTFGWSLASSQEVNTVDSHLERRYDEIYSVTTKENYVKLVFKRDTGIRNYVRIVQLERQYHAILNEEPKISQGKIALAIIVALVTIFLWMIPGILLFVHTIKEYKAACNVWVEKLNTQGGAILNEVRQLI